MATQIDLCHMALRSIATPWREIDHGTYVLVSKAVGDSGRGAAQAKAGTATSDT